MSEHAPARRRRASSADLRHQREHEEKDQEREQERGREGTQGTSPACEPATPTPTSTRTLSDMGTPYGMVLHSPSASPSPPPSRRLSESPSTTTPEDEPRCWSRPGSPSPLFPSIAPELASPLVLASASVPSSASTSDSGFASSSFPPPSLSDPPSFSTPPRPLQPPPLPFELWQRIAHIIREDYQDAHHPRRVCEPVHDLDYTDDAGCNSGLHACDEPGQRCRRPKGTRGGWMAVQRTLSSLARTNKLIHDAVTPILYHAPIVRHLDLFFGLAKLDTSSEGDIYSVHQTLPTLRQPILAALALHRSDPGAHSRSPSPLSLVRNLHIVPEAISPALFASCRAAHDAHQPQRRCVLRHILARCPAYAPIRVAVREYRRRLLVVLAAAVFERARPKGKVLLPQLETVCIGAYDLHTSADARPWVHPHAMSELGHRDADTVLLYHALMHVVFALQPRVVHLRTSDAVRRWPKTVNTGHVMDTVFRELAEVAEAAAAAAAVAGGGVEMDGDGHPLEIPDDNALPHPRTPRFEVHLAAPGSNQVCMPLIYGAPVRVRLYIPNEPRESLDHESEDTDSMLHAVRRLIGLRQGSHSWTRLLPHRARHYKKAKREPKTSFYASVALDMDIILPVLPITWPLLYATLGQMGLDEARGELLHLKKTAPGSEMRRALERACRQMAHQWMVHKMRDHVWREDRLCGRSYKSTGGEGDEIRWGSVLADELGLEMEMDGEREGEGGEWRRRARREEVVQVDGWDRLLKEWPHGEIGWDAVNRECLALGRGE